MQLVYEMTVEAFFKFVFSLGHRESADWSVMNLRVVRVMKLIAVFAFAVGCMSGALRASFTYTNDSTINSAISNGLLGSHSALSSNGYSLTVDELSGLQWLDISVTRGLSRTQVTDLMSDNGPLKGFRYASIEEISSFLTRAGVVGVGLSSTQSSHYSASISLHGLWGYSRDGVTSNWYGNSIFGDFIHNTGWIRLSSGVSYSWWTWQPSYSTSAYSYNSAPNVTPGFGSALVRQSVVVPEPNALLLFYLGSCLMANLRLRRQVYH